MDEINENENGNENEKNKINIELKNIGKNQNEDINDKSNEIQGLLNDNEKQKNLIDNSNEEKENNIKNRSLLSLEGAKYPLSMYTRRVMNTSKIINFLREDSSRGICGSQNLGNTCFMNSSIACISNCTELTYYFLCGDYKKDINRENKNGMGGELAEAWGELLQKYWVDNTSAGNPLDLKNIIGKKAERFRGFGQQDSNEFMSIFLDILNEDLNAITVKKYFELEEKKENESDEECSTRFWELNLNRNDSIITDLFCGQFKSTVTCPNCNWISITFESFYSIDLPLKKIKKKYIQHFEKKNLENYNFFYVTRYGLRTPYLIQFHDIPNTIKISECLDILKNERTFRYRENTNEVNYMKIDSKIFIGEIDGDELINEYDQNIFIFETNNEENIGMKIPIYLFDLRENKISLYPRFVFGKNNINIEELKKNIYFIVRKFIISPFINYGEEIDMLSKIITKYKTDISIKDEYVFDLIDKEYQRIFSEFPSQEDIEFLLNYIQDMPFKINLREIQGEKIIQIFREDNLNMLSDEFQEITGVSSLETPIRDFQNAIKDYVLVVEFDQNSKYINKTNFKLDAFFPKKMKFPKIEEEDKKEEEENKNDEETQKYNLIQCINDFCQEEQLKKGNDWLCKNCKQQVLPKKKIDIYYLPKILIICFKRFIKESSIWEKNEINIDFPINNFDTKDIIIGPDKYHSIYDLFAVSQHYGTTNSGHYTAICKNGNRWYNYDDSHVSETSPRAALSPSAYVLFYRRQTD